MGKILTTVTIDLHNLTTDAAHKQLTWKISHLPPTIKKVIVIHGCNGGTAIRDMVRHRFKHSRILEIIPTFSNDGETQIYLK